MERPLGVVVQSAPASRPGLGGLSPQVQNELYTVRHPSYQGPEVIISKSHVLLTFD